MADPHTTDPSPQRFRRGQPASERLRDASFPTAVRGYDRRAVDDFLEELRSLVADLEARQTREGVVQKALDELGEETAGILQRAHETADEIASRSRAQADGRLQRAEREAEIVKRDADEYAEQVVVDTRLLWDERQRLIEDIRQLADEVLGTADDAIDRLKLPDPLGVAEQDPEPTTAEDRARPIPHPLSLAGSDRAADPGVPFDMEQPDPDATQPWLVEAEDEQDPDTTAPYAVEDEEGPATAPYAIEDEQDPTERFALDDDPDAGALEDDPDAGGSRAVEAEPGDTEPDEEGSGGTIELEALPGGNGDDQPGERERD